MFAFTCPLLYLLMMPVKANLTTLAFFNFETTFFIRRFACRQCQIDADRLRLDSRIKLLCVHVADENHLSSKTKRFVKAHQFRHSEVLDGFLLNALCSLLINTDSIDHLFEHQLNLNIIRIKSARIEEQSSFLSASSISSI